MNSAAPESGPLDPKALVSAIRNAGQMEKPVRTPSRNGLLVSERNLEGLHPEQLLPVLATDSTRNREKRT